MIVLTAALVCTRIDRIAGLLKSQIRFRLTQAREALEQLITGLVNP